MRLAIVADPDHHKLHGIAGAFAWGEAVALPPDGDVSLYDRAIALGSVSALRPPDVRWGAGGDAVRVIATEGEGLLHRAPLPAADALWELPPGGRALLVGALDAAAAALRDLGIDAACVPSLTYAGLAGAAVVAFAGAPAEPLPAAAFAVLAAGRLLIAPHAAPSFGLIAGADHLAYGHPADLPQLVDAGSSFPQAFEPIIALGRLAAESQRASVVYGRLARELAALARNASA